MRSEARVVVIGGGVVGCSVLYHLTKLGWRDVVLLERDELTSGSTWHAAGGMHTINSDPNVAKLQDYTIRLYKELEAISGLSCGIHLTGGIMLAGTPERLDFLKTAHARGRLLGLEGEFISLDEVRRRHPLIDTRHFAGALFDPNEGHIDPSGVTNAYARSAQKGGAEVNRFTPVTALHPTADGGWRVVTPKGEIRAEIVVNAGGLWAREVGRLVGLELPVLAMEHHYLITEDLPEIAARSEELPHAIDFEAEIYTRQEGKGLLLGTYERACVPWSPKTTPMDFGHELLAPDLDRIAPSPRGRVPAFPGARARRHQARDQRPVHLRARRQPAGRAGAGAAQLLLRLRRDGGFFARRRRRARRSPTGSSRATPAWTSSRWTSRASAISRPAPTPTPKSGKTTAAASRSPFPTRSCRPRGRSARRRSTIA